MSIPDRNGALIDIGDTIECLDNSRSLGFLTVGRSYILTDIAAPLGRSHAKIRVDHQQRLWRPDRFALVQINRMNFTQGGQQQVVSDVNSLVNKGCTIVDLGKMADSIIALINSQARSPYKQEIVEALKKCL